MEDEELEKIKRKKLQEMIAKHKQMQNLNQQEILDLTHLNFDSTVNSTGLVLVDFWAEWCGPCRSMHPIFQRVAKIYPTVKFARVNIDQNQPLAIRLGVQAIPTFIMFKDGREVQRVMGAVGESGLRMIINKYLD